MKTPLFASLPAKVAAGVAGVALLTGGAGTVLNLQPAGTSSTAEDTVEAAEVEETTTTTSTTSTTEAPTTKKRATTAAEDDEKVASTEHPDNFGAMVSEDAKDGGVDGQEISAKAHARNEARRADRAATSVDDTDDDDDTKDDEDEKTSPADAHRKDDRPAKG